MRGGFVSAIAIPSFTLCRAAQSETSGMIEFLKEHQGMILWAAMLFSLAEYSVTAVCVRRAGPDIEDNPLLRLILRRFGLPALAAFWCLIWTLVFTVVKPGPFMSAFLLALSFGLLVTNLIAWRYMDKDSEKGGE